MGIRQRVNQTMNYIINYAHHCRMITESLASDEESVMT